MSTAIRSKGIRAFIFNVWTPGEIDLTDGSVIKNIYLQYDQYLDELLWLRKSDRRAIILSRDIVAGFRLFDSNDKLMATFAKKKVNLPFTGLKDAYLQVLMPGNPGFYVWRNSYVMASDNRLVERPRYLIIAEGKDYPVRLSKRSLLNLTAIDKSKMKAILHSERIMPQQDEQEFARAISRYNQLKK